MEQRPLPTEIFELVPPEEPHLELLPALDDAAAEEVEEEDDEPAAAAELVPVVEPREGRCGRLRISEHRPQHDDSNGGGKDVRT